MGSNNTRINKWTFFEEIGYNPHPRQRLYHNSGARFKIPVCGRRFGKSTMSARDLEPELFEPFKYFWIAGPTYDLGEKEFRVIWDDLMIKKGLIHDRRIKKGYNVKGGTMYIEFPWRTRLEVRSAQHPESLVGEGLDGAIISEAAKHKRETWERFLRPALADKRGWADFTTTPEGQNWLYTMWRLGQNPDFEDYASWRFPSWENPYVYPGGRQDPEIILLEQTTATEWFLQEIAADFTSFVGKIYSEWDESIHVTKVEYDPALPNYIAWDWGFVNPLAAIEFQITPNDEIRIWREHYLAFHTLEDHFELMRQRPQPEGYKITQTFGDSADQEAVMRVNQKFGPCIALEEAKTNWREGIDLVKMFLKENHTGDNDEQGFPIMRPKLFVDHSCVNTITEFGSYRGKKPTTSQDPQDKPQKINDHAMDAIRYGLMHVFKLGATYSLTDVMTMPEPRGLYRPDTDGYLEHPREKVVAIGSGGGYFNMNESF